MKQKPSKPYPDFPLYPHASGQWAKKVRGRVYYFGVWDDVDAARDRWLDVRDELLAGKTPVSWDPDLLTVSECLNLALSSKKKKMRAGELDEKTYGDYKAVATEILTVFGRNKPASLLRPHDFQKLRKHLSAGRSIVTLRNLIRRARVLFNWCVKNGHLDSTGKLWGTEFTVPSARLLRIKRNDDGPRFIEASRIHQLVNGAPSQLKAMILLGINCGYGPNDCGDLCWSHIDQWASLARNKTGVTRKAWLWPETIAALGERSEGLVFRTRYGNPWLASALCHEFQKLRTPDEKIGFYWLRHTFLTIAEETKDFEAARVVMGHVDASITGQYRESVSDSRIQAVCNHVRKWFLLGRASKPHARE